MAGIARSRETALEMARLLEEGKGEDTVVLALGELSSFTDYFLIATVRSSVHLSGLARRIAGFLKERDLKALYPRKRMTAKGWLVMDCGDIVVHLMEKDVRAFYDLEHLWFRAERISYSSKSS